MLDIKVFLQEALAGFLLMFFFYPSCQIFDGNSWFVWALHFFFIVVLNYASCGSSINPSVNIALYLDGTFSMSEAISRTIGCCVGSIVALPVLVMLASEIINKEGHAVPSELKDISKENILEQFAKEFGSTAVLMACVYIMPRFGEKGGIYFLAGVLRFLGYVWSDPAMNPVVAVGHYMYNYSESHNFFYIFFVYFMAPTLGCITVMLARTTSSNSETKMKID
jgi:glycerol uptake facilitator-like aquaporin